MQKNGISKASQVRKYILDSLEDGVFGNGKRLPGAKKMAAELNVSHAVVQSVLDSLVCEGILFAVPRGGSYVHPDWRERVLQTNITAFLTTRHWYKSLQKILQTNIPEMRLTGEFKESVYEIRTTTHVQAHHDKYMDLAPLLDECFPDKRDFEMEPFKSFYFDGKLTGIPFMYSPRVMFYHPQVLLENDCGEPDADWTWDDFIEIVLQLRNRIEPAKIIHWTAEPFFWMNIVIRNGGCLVNPKLAEPVRIDSEETIQGLEKVRQLGQLVNRSKGSESYHSFWEQGSIAFHIGGRDRVPFLNKYGMKNWKVIPLPKIPGGVDASMQITDLLCIRKSYTNLEHAKKLLKIMLSQKFQDGLATADYGIPIRKSSATKTLDPEDPRNLVFLTEAKKVQREYNLNSPELYNVVTDGVEICLQSDADIRPALKKLADVVRTLTAIKSKTWNINI